MSDHARKKQKQRLKREKKHLQMRKAVSVSPQRRIADAAAAGTAVECYINPDWHEEGMAEVCVLREVPALGGHVVAIFQVDSWCLGLKDAFGRLDMTPREFHDEVIPEMKERIGLEPVPLEEARALIASAIRFSRENGFRLPHHYERWVATLGELDIENADLSEFRDPDGFLRYVGSLDDLERRLIHTPLLQFVARDDVIIEERPDNLEDWDEAQLGNLADRLEEVRENGVQAVRKWFLERGEKPSAHLGEAFELMLAAGLAVGAADPDEVEDGEDDDESVDPTTVDRAMAWMDEQLTAHPESNGPIREALTQIQDYVRQSQQTDFLHALGFEGPEPNE